MNEKERKKVKFSLTKFTKKGSFRFVGFGEIDEIFIQNLKFMKIALDIAKRKSILQTNSKAVLQNLKKSNLKTKSIKS